MFFLKLNRKINITISIINNLLLKTNDKTRKPLEEQKIKKQKKLTAKTQHKKSEQE